MPTADLHTHSTASDGELAPAALVEKARALGLSTLALTDHDNTLGVSEAR
ncbi:MAG: PHP domain-containing protein, partial [Rectinema sp.]